MNNAVMQTGSQHIPIHQAAAEFQSWMSHAIGEYDAERASVEDYGRLWDKWVTETDLIVRSPSMATRGAVQVEQKLGNSELTETKLLREKMPFCHGSLYLGHTIETEVVQVRKRFEQVSTALGHVGEGHGLVVADTRFGKLVRMLQPTIGTWPGSLVAIDNSGELASINAERRGQGNPLYCDGLGQNVFVLDPQNATTVSDEYRATWNPLDCLHLDDPSCIEKAEKLADAVSPAEEAVSDPYWKDEGKAFLGALFIYVGTDERYTSCGQNTLNTVYGLICAGDVDTLADLHELGELEADEGDPCELLFTAMKASLGGDYVSLAGHHLQQLFTGAKKQWEGIRSQARTALAWVAKPAMKTCLAASNFSFADLKTNPNGMSVFISLKDLSSEWRWVRMLLSMLALESKTYDKPATGHSTLVVMDEFPKLRPMPVILEFLDCMAKHDVRMLIVCQSLDQLQSVYPKDWERFYAAADVRWFFGAESHKTRKYLEEELGEKEIIRLTRSQSQARGYTTSDSVVATKTQSASASDASTEGENTSWQDGHSKGTNSNWNKGTNRNESYKESVIALLPLVNKVPLIKGSQKSRGRQNSDGGGTNEATNHSTGGGTNKSTTKTVNATHGGSVGRNSGQSEQFTGTQTINETLHKVPVVPAAELPYLLAACDDANDPRYPGQALVCIRGGLRFLVRTKRYYEDPILYRTFGKHPAHPFQQSPMDPRLLAQQILREEQLREEQEQQRTARAAQRERMRKSEENRTRQEAEEKRLEAETQLASRMLAMADAAKAQFDENNHTTHVDVFLPHTSVDKWLASIPDEEVTLNLKKTRNTSLKPNQTIAKLSSGVSLLSSPNCPTTLLGVRKKVGGWHFDIEVPLQPTAQPKWLADLRSKGRLSKAFHSHESIDSFRSFVVTPQAGLVVDLEAEKAKRHKECLKPYRLAERQFATYQRGRRSYDNMSVQDRVIGAFSAAGKKIGGKLNEIEFSWGVVPLFAVLIVALVIFVTSSWLFCATVRNTFESHRALSRLDIRIEHIENRVIDATVQPETARAYKKRDLEKTMAERTSLAADALQSKALLGCFFAVFAMLMAFVWKNRPGPGQHPFAASQ